MMRSFESTVESRSNVRLTSISKPLFQRASTSNADPKITGKIPVLSSTGISLQSRKDSISHIQTSVQGKPLILFAEIMSLSLTPKRITKQQVINDIHHRMAKAFKAEFLRVSSHTT